ncbi:MAG: hypothetical protein RJA61_429 [Candidatus Parcubacteria bacterium]|jgi:ParB/RepB/Spo0J family partition protein
MTALPVVTSATEFPLGVVSIGQPGQPSVLLRSRIRPCLTQPRTNFNLLALQDLATSIGEEGQNVPIEVIPVAGDPDHDFELTDGERRWRACGMAGVKTMKAWICPVKDSLEQLKRSLGANFGREPHTPLETANALKRMKDMMGDEPKVVQRIAAVCSKTVAWVYQHLSLLSLHPDVQALLEPDAPKERRMSMSVALPLTSLRQDLQVQLANEIVGQKMSAKTARLHIRQAVESHDEKVGSGVVRNPNKDFKMLINFCERGQQDLEYFRRLGTVGLQRLLASRIKAEKMALVELVESVMKGHRELRDLILTFT